MLSAVKFLASLVRRIWDVNLVRTCPGSGFGKSCESRPQSAYAVGSISAGFSAPKIDTLTNPLRVCVEPAQDCRASCRIESKVYTQKRVKQHSESEDGSAK